MPNQYGYFMPADEQQQRMYPTNYQPARPVYVNQLAQMQPQTIQYYSTPMYFVQNIDEVHGKEVRAGEMAMFFDATQNKLYVKSVSQNGIPAPLKILKYEEEVEEPPVSKADIDDLRKQLTDMQTKLADLLK